MSEATGATAAAAATTAGSGEAVQGTQTAAGEQSAASDAQLDAGTTAEAAEKPTDTAEKPKRKTPKEWAKEALEQDFDDDDSADDFVRDYADNLHKLNKQTRELFEVEWEAGAAVQKAMKDGVPFITALSEYITPEEYAEMVANSDGSKEAIAKRKEAIKAQKEHDAIVEKNRKASEANIVSFAQKNNISDAEIGDFFSKTVAPVFQSLLNQDLNENLLTIMWKAHKFDSEVADAAKIGEVKAANTKIIKEKPESKGDGLPQVGGGAGKTREIQKAASSIARIAQQNQEERQRIS